MPARRKHIGEEDALALGAAFRAAGQPRRRGLVAIGRVDTAWTGAVVRVILTQHVPGMV